MKREREAELIVSTNEVASSTPTLTVSSIEKVMIWMRSIRPLYTIQTRDRTRHKTTQRSRVA